MTESKINRTHSSYTPYLEYTNAKYHFDHWFRRTQHNYWKRLDGRSFEIAVKHLFEKLGNKAELVGGTNDRGIDILVDDDTVVQCKAHKSPVSPAVARELYGAMTDFGARRGILVSRNGFTKGVKDFVRNKPIELLDVNDLIRMQNGRCRLAPSTNWRSDRPTFELAIGRQAARIG